MRSVIVTTDLAPDGDGGFGLETGLDRQELRLWLLLADKIDHPVIDRISVQSTPEEEFLEACGAMIRTPVKATPTSDYGFLIEPHIRLFEERQRKEPGQWTLAGATSRPSFGWAIRGEYSQFQGLPTKRRLTTPTFQLTLARAIPVPDKDVAFNELLEFKHKRRDELLSLRHHLDDTYQSVLAAPDRPLAELTVIERLSKSLQDQVRISKEAGLLTRRSTLSVSFNIVGALSAFVAAMPMGIISASALSLGAGAAIEIGKSIGLASEVSGGSPLEYVGLFHSEMFP